MTISDITIGTEGEAGGGAGGPAELVEARGGTNPLRPAQGAEHRGTTDLALREWVADLAALTKPDEIVWCDGSRHEADLLTKQLVAEGKLVKLNPPEWRPNSYLARTDPGDVAASRTARSSARRMRRTPARRTTGGTRARCATSSSTCSTAR